MRSTKISLILILVFLAGCGIRSNVPLPTQSSTLTPAVPPISPSTPTTTSLPNLSPTSDVTAVPIPVSSVETETPLPSTSPTPVISSGSPVHSMVIFHDQPGEGWQNWSWGTTVDVNGKEPVKGGSSAIALTFTTGWSAFYLHKDNGLETRGYDQLRFWVHGGSTGGQGLRLVVEKNEDETYPFTATAKTWTQVIVPLDQIGSPESLTDLFWQDTTGGSQPVFYLDEIELVASGAPLPPTATPPAPLDLRIDAGAEKRAINPDIYGINFADEALAAELRLPVNRWGGNATTRYNWQNDTSNRASDWFFENIPNDNANPSSLPDGSSSDHFIEQNKRTGTSSLITIPMIGWTPKSRAVTCGYSIGKYGDQQKADPYRADCGNGILPDGNHMTGNDPKDTSIEIDPSFVQDWMKHLIARYGSAAEGGVKFYNLDNEPALWHLTHRDVHPKPVGYDELRDRTYQYAAAIKAADPSAQTLGPVEWGWSGYFFSALDGASGGNWWDLPLDRLAHGNTPLVEWYLQQMKAYKSKNGTRILDYLDLHYYPQASGVALQGAGNASTQALRLRTTRSLWDPEYKDESWIEEPVRLIPRMREWVNNNYPGTKLAMTEYNFGALDHINGALAQADVLGIFGREGLDLATLWSPPAPDQPGAFAFRMYRNYDGKNSAFGETSIQATSPDSDKLSIFASKRKVDGALTLMLINKTAAIQTGAVSLDNFTSADRALVYRYGTDNLKAIVQDSNLMIQNNRFNVVVPAHSIALVILPPR